MKLSVLTAAVAVVCTACVLPSTGRAQVPAQGANSSQITYGKYGCTSTSGSAAQGTYSIQPRGSYVITANGRYTYHGYEKPSSGSFTLNAQGVIHFKDGAFNGGEATPLGNGYPHQFFLVYPGMPGNRWKCKLVE